MRLIDITLMIFLGSLWGISFVFTRSTVGDFGPIALIAMRVGVAALCLLPFLFSTEKRRKEFAANWFHLAWIGIISTSAPFMFLAYSSINLTAGTVSLLNAMVPIFTALIAHMWLKESMSKLQFLGLAVSISGLIILFWGKVSFDSSSWLPVLAGLSATLCYGVATNGMKKYLSNVSIMTKTAGSFLFAAIFMLILTPFFMPNFSEISSISWFYAIALGVLCTALAYAIFFRLLNSIGAAKAVTVTFIVPIFSFLWGYLLLGELVTLRMWGATLVVLFAMGLVLQIIGKSKD